MSEKYPFREIEEKWQKRWDQRQAFRAANPGEPGSEKPKYFVLDFFPYPSGAGLHVGHPLGYIATDIVARYKRMRGFNVLHPMGWDAFGLPAEQYAVETGIHPAVTTRKNIATYKRQMCRLGLGYDWDRELATIDEDYYRWTQWIFLKIFNSWYDPEWRWTDSQGRAVIGAARPIEKLPIPAEVKAEGLPAVEAYRAEHRLAYLSEVPVNWCPALGTVLANEEVTNEGRSERGDHPVHRRPMRQWMLRITEYADRLLHDLDELDWPEPIKLMQRNWIGRSEGAYVDFELAGERSDIIRVFTTRPDTLYGATYMVLAPEHPLVSVITAPQQRNAVNSYIELAAQKTDMDRTADAKSKTGVFTGAHAVNPVNRKRVPIWVADYVLMGYGTGSIMAVPGHDTRDLQFAETFRLDVVQVVQPPQGQDWRGYVGDGTACNSPSADEEHFDGQCDFNGLPTSKATAKITKWLEDRDLGEGTTQYKLRDWLFSRQRYWGEPFPILHRDDGVIESVAESELPVLLPEMEDFKPSVGTDPQAEPQTPLSRAAGWAVVERDARKYRRELNTMPQWAGSCWYYLRFCDPKNSEALIGPQAEQYWMTSEKADGTPHTGGIDLYLGGAEHAVLHLLYARFWHKVLYDIGSVSTPEPFGRLFNQGMIGAAAYTTERGVYVPADEVSQGEPLELVHVDPARRAAALNAGKSPEQAEAAARVTTQTRFYHDGKPVFEAFEKMSKSKKNVVNPDSIIDEYGADTLRLYEMYMGPLEASKPWNTRDIVGVHRFLHRTWRLIIDPDTGRISAKIGQSRDEALEKLLHKTIKKVSEDIESLGFNTAIAALITWINEAMKAEHVHRDQIDRFVALLNPFAPHICEELAQRLGRSESLTRAAWPTFDEAMTRDDQIEMAVQIRGKLKGRITVAVGAPQDEIITAAREAVKDVLGDMPIKKAIVVPGRLVNLVV